MKTAFRALGAGLIALVGVLLWAPAASATQQSDTVTIVWQMPSWKGSTPTWPQQIVSHTANVGLDVTVPDCGFFQVDVYKYGTESDKAKVDALIKGGVLTAPNNPPEPLIPGGLGTAWKFVNAGVCETATPTPSPSDSSDTPTPTPSETTQTPTPTPTATPSETSPTATPSESSTTATPTPSGSTTTGTPTTTPTPSFSENGGCVPTADAPCELPKTGSAVSALGALAAGLLALGGTALYLTRRKGSHV